MATASWRDLPRREQLVVITLARLSEPLVQTSIQSYMFYQLKWFDPSLPDSVISSQAGILQCVIPFGSGLILDDNNMCWTNTAFLQRELHGCPIYHCSNVGADC